ncbi:hypothetical protein ACVIGB_000888 [Bradyrhizobium sp. USDA 4341]
MTVTLKKVGDIIPAQFRNDGRSFGLDYPFIYANDLAQWLIWNRHTGEVVYLEDEANPALAEDICRKRCEQLNAVPPITAELIAAYDATP